MSNPRGQQRDKPFRDALRLVAVQRDRLRQAAEALMTRAEKGDVNAIREVADRLDGRVAQAIVGDDEHDPIRVEDVSNEDRAKAIKMLVDKVRNKK